MKTITTAIERAFELAKSGKYLYLIEIVLQLRAESYSTETLTGPQLSHQLKGAIWKARRERGKPPPQEADDTL